jgi:NitT/TauT family transport system substrate-binding protein
MVLKIRAALWTAALALLACTPAPVLAAGKLVLMVGGIEKQIYLPVVLAQRLGYFHEQGLEVDVSSETSGVSASDVLLSGGADAVAGAYDHTIDLQAKGKSVKAIVQFTTAPGEAMLVASRSATRIVTPAQLEGANVGVTGLGSSTSFLTRYLAAAHGVNPATLKLLPVESGQTFMNALRRGRIDAGMTAEPTASRLIASGDARLLVDLRTPASTQKALGGLYPFTCLYVRTDWLMQHRPEAQKLAAALVKALRFIATHSAAEIATQLPGEFFAGQKAVYVQSLALSKSMFTPDGVMPPSGPASVLRVLSTVNSYVRAKNVDLADTYTNEFVRTGSAYPR